MVVNKGTGNPDREADRLVEWIRRLEILGAGDVARAVARILALRAEGWHERLRERRAAGEGAGTSADTATGERLLAWLDEQYRELINLKPSMASIANAGYNILTPVREAVREGAAPGDLARLVRGAAEAFISKSERAAATIADRGAGLITPGMTVLTYSYSETVRTILIRARNQGTAFSLCVTEARPLHESYLLAQAALEVGIPTTVAADSALGLLVARADLVLVGADTVEADGTVINKAGTFLLALAARELGKPFYVAAESSKRVPPPEFGYRAILEERPGEELLTTSVPDIVRQKAFLLNPFFDRTPAKLITGIIAEDS